MPEEQQPDRLPITQEEIKQAEQELHENEGPDRRDRFYGRRESDKHKEINRRWIALALVIFGTGVFVSQFLISNQSDDIQQNQKNIANIVVATNLWGCAIVTANSRAERLKFLDQYGKIVPDDLPLICTIVASRSLILAQRALKGENITGQVTP